jgi:CheY-like chemotaxis protein
VSGEEEMKDAKPPEPRGEQEPKKWHANTWVRLVGVTGAIILLVRVAGVIVDWYINPEDPEMKRKLVKALAFDAPMRLLEIVLAWPVIVLVTLLLFRRPIGEFIHDHLPELLSRMKTAKVPGGFEFDFTDMAEMMQNVVNKGVKEHGDDPKEFTDYVVEQTNKLPMIAAAPSAGQPNLQGRHLLWVDDNPANNVVEMNIIERLGATISLATSTEEALKKARQIRYDVIISDMGRREDGIDNHNAGYELLDKLQEELNIMPPFVIYAGWNAPGPAEVKQRGAFGSTNDPQELLHLVINAVQNVSNTRAKIH